MSEICTETTSKKVIGLSEYFLFKDKRYILVIYINDQLEEIATASYVRGVEISGEEYNLYPEFEDPEKAFEDVKMSSQNAINFIRNTYDVEDLSSEAIKVYQGYTTMIIENMEVDDENIISEIKTLDEFLNMYENTNINDEIVEVIESLDGNFMETNVIDVADIVSEIQILAPFNTGISEALDEVVDKIVEDIDEEYDISSEELEEMYQETLEELYEDVVAEGEDYSKHLEQILYRENTKFNISKGVTYANTYATKRNKSYRSFDYDCTNFVSQIKKAGGVTKPYYSYKVNGNHAHVDSAKSWFYSGYYNYGQVWTVADKFAKFYGIKSTTKDFYTLSTRVKQGSFIAYSKYGDGKWNHMAFVTGKSNNKKKTNGVTYYDFKVAQHTRDYNLWVSAKDNGWEQLKSNYSKLSFAIVN